MNEYDSPEAKKLQATIDELNKRVLLYTLWPGHEEGMPWHSVLTKASTEAKRLDVFIPVYRVISEYPEVLSEFVGSVLPTGVFVERNH